MKILIDENLPESLAKALSKAGHQTDSINSLKLKGLDNGSLYKEVAQNYDLCFTKDSGFAHNVKQMRIQSKVELLLVTMSQKPAVEFVRDFSTSFSKTDWERYKNGDEWP